MTGKSYVGEKTHFYDVVEKSNGWIELRVSHGNTDVCRLLKKHQSSPSYFLSRRNAFHRSQTRAEQELAAVLDDFHSYFAQNRVTIIL